MVSVAGGLENVSVYLDTVPKYRLSWSAFYAVVVLLGLLTVLAAELGVPYVGTVSGIIWASAFFALVFVSGVYPTSPGAVPSSIVAAQTEVTAADPFLVGLARTPPSANRPRLG